MIQIFCINQDRISYTVLHRASENYIHEKGHTFSIFRVLCLKWFDIYQVLKPLKSQMYKNTQQLCVIIEQKWAKLE